MRVLLSGLMLRQSLGGRVELVGNMVVEDP